MKQELLEMKIGHTKNIGGKAVTRWSESAYEVGTWGRKFKTADEALSELAQVRCDSIREVVCAEVGRG